MKHRLDLVFAVLVSGALLFGKGLLGPCSDPAGGNRPAVYKTKHFDIIYDMDRPEAAIAVSRVCEQSFDQIQSNLGVDLDLHLPVVATPRKNSLNAYFTSFPYNKIVIFDTPAYAMELENLGKGVEKVFHHELSHAVSMNIRTPLWDFIASLVGPWANPGLVFYQNQAFTEGLAVAFESLGGGGRLNDPYSMELLVQGKMEGRHPKWIDIAGSRDIRPAGGLPYLYGGAFSGHLIKKFGIAKWSDFVKSSSKIGWSLLPGKFKKTYNVSLADEFDAFLAKVPSVPDAADLGANICASPRLASVGFAGAGLWLSDPGRGRVVIINPENGQIQSSTVLQSYEPELCYSEDGTIKAFSIVNEDEVKTVVEWPGGRREHKNLRRPCIAGGRLVGVENSGSSERIRIFDLEEGRTAGELALPWPWNAVSLQRLDDQVILLVLSDGKTWNVGALDIGSLDLRLVENPDSIQIRTLGPSDDGAAFSYFYPEVDGNLARYGKFVFKDGAVARLLSPINTSGGVHRPAERGGRVFFIGSFFDEDRLRTAPEADFALGEPLALHLVEADLEGETILAEDFLAASQPYDPASRLKKGSLLPMDIGPSGLVGLSYVTSDPAENYILSIGAGCNLEANIAGASLLLADASWRLVPFDIQNSLAVGWDLRSNLPAVLWNSGLAIQRTRWGYASELALGFRNNRARAKFSNHIEFFAFRPMGPTPFEKLGCGAGLGMDVVGFEGAFKTALVLDFSISLPRLLPFEKPGGLVRGLPAGLGFFLRLQKDPMVGGSARIVLFDWETQKGVPWLSLYVRRVYLSAEADWNACLASGERAFGARILARADFAPILGLALQNLGLSFFVGLERKAGQDLAFVCGLDSSLFGDLDPRS